MSMHNKEGHTLKQYRIIDPEKILEIINRLDFFKDFSPEEKKALSEHDQFVAFFKKGETIIKEGDQDAIFYILLLGKASVVKGIHQDSIGALKPGDCFGEISFLIRSPRTATVIADTDTVAAIRISQEMTHELDIKICEKIKDKLIKMLVERLDRMNRFLINTKHGLPESETFSYDPTHFI